MGIKNLSKLLRRYAASGISEISLSDLSGKAIAIDVSIYMYKFMYSTNGEPIPCFLRIVDSCDSFGITPIFVFDGVASPAKFKELEKRREDRERCRKQLEEIEQKLEHFSGTVAEKRSMNIERLKMSRRVHSVPNRRHYMALRECLQRHGVDIVEANGDAEKECVRLVHAGRADVVVTEDFDTLPYMAGISSGRGLLVTGFAGPRLLQYDMSSILSEMEIDRESFIDVCILSGCDFCCKIKGIAIFRSFSLIKKHGTIESVLENLEPKYVVPECFAYEVARREFCGR